MLNKHNNDSKKKKKKAKMVLKNSFKVFKEQKPVESKLDYSFCNKTVMIMITMMNLIFMHVPR